jgi:hypothetical protein
MRIALIEPESSTASGGWLSSFRRSSEISTATAASK